VPNSSPSINQIANEQRVYRLLKKIGLPVPVFSRAMLKKTRRDKSSQISLIIEDVRQRVGKLYDCHKSGDPIFLSKLKVNKDYNLIKDLAQDLAKIHSNGLTTEFVDFWHFYRVGKWSLFKRGSWGRIFIDFNKLYFERNIGQTKTKQNKKEVLQSIKDNMRKETWKLFYQEYKNAINHNLK
jgi:hypothetical protein